MRDIETAGSTWADHQGAIRQVPISKKLSFSKTPLHAALRAFVFIRDGFKCQWCGTTAKEIPFDYDGRLYVAAQRESRAGYTIYLAVDHVLSRRNGGSNHPSNLQTLCDCCNAAKSGLVDAKHGRAHGTH